MTISLSTTAHVGFSADALEPKRSASAKVLDSGLEKARGYASCTNTHLYPLCSCAFTYSQNEGRFFSSHLLLEPPIVVTFPERSKKPAGACSCAFSGTFRRSFACLAICGLVASCCRVCFFRGFGMGSLCGITWAGKGRLQKQARLHVVPTAPVGQQRHTGHYSKGLSTLHGVILSHQSSEGKTAYGNI